MKRNSFMLPDHFRKYSMTQQQEQMREQDKQRKRTERQGRNGSQQNVHTPEEERHRALSREREKKMMDEARAARSQTARRALRKRTRSEGHTPNRVLRARK